MSEASPELSTEQHDAAETAEVVFRDETGAAHREQLDGEQIDTIAHIVNAGGSLDKGEDEVIA